MSARHRALLRMAALLAILLVLAAACTDPGPRPGAPDATPDTASDTAADADADATSDALSDALSDAIADATPDAPADTAADAAPDAPADTAADAAPDAPADTAADPYPDAPADTGSDTASDAAPDAAPDTAADTASDAAPDAAPDTAADTAADADPDATSDTRSDTTADAVPDAASNPASDAVPDIAPDAVPDGTSGSDTSGAAPCGKPGVCFAPKPPDPDARIADVPPDDTAGCKPDAAALIGLPLKGGPSLPVKLGRASKPSSAITPFVQGEFVPLVHGAQGLLHVEVGVAVTLPGVKVEARAMRLILRGYLGCQQVAAASLSTVWMSPTDGAPVVYHNLSALGGGTRVIFPAGWSKACDYCGRWLDLRVWVYDKPTGAWGQARVMVRLFDSGP